MFLDDRNEKYLNTLMEMVYMAGGFIQNEL